MLTPLLLWASLLFQDVGECRPRTGPMEPTALLSDSAARGCRKVLEEIACDPPTWEKFLAGVEAGTPPWQDVTVAFWMCSDGFTAEDILVSLSALLARDPIAALSSIARTQERPGAEGQSLAPALVCGNIEGSSTSVDAAALVRAQRKAISGVTGKRWRRLRSECLAAIELAELSLERRAGEQ